jgi:peptide deformylase
MELVFYPDPVLQRRAEDVDPGRNDLRAMAEGMLGVMKENQGVGLAAPQVGEAVRLFVASDTGEPEDAVVCVNPRIEPFGPVVEMEEGCLSVPGFRAMIRRPEGVRIRFRGLDGVEREEEFHELLARIIQHEADHLDGILFFERMTESDRLQCRPHLKALEEQFRPR